MEEQTWNYSGEFLKRAKIIISDKQILLENRELSFMRFPWQFFVILQAVFYAFMPTIQEFASNYEELLKQYCLFLTKEASESVGCRGSVL